MHKQTTKKKKRERENKKETAPSDVASSHGGLALKGSGPLRYPVSGDRRDGRKVIYIRWWEQGKAPT